MLCNGRDDVERVRKIFRTEVAAFSSTCVRHGDVMCAAVESAGSDYAPGEPSVSVAETSSNW